MSAAQRIGRVQRALVRDLAKGDRECMLCGTTDSQHVAVFMPRDQASWGVAPGKLRLIAYALCTSCFRLPDHAVAVERRLRGSAVRMVTEEDLDVAR